MNFISVFVIAVIFIWSILFNVIIARRRWFTSFGSLAMALLVPAVVVLLFKLIMGYDFLQGFLLTVRLENPEGFRPLTQPFKYLVTRLKDVGDILLLFGPVGSVMLYGTIREKSLRREHNLFAMIGIAILLLGFLTGAYRTGESSRPNLFILPYLILATVDQFQDVDKDGSTMLDWLFVQTLVMQSFLGFGW